MRNAIISRIENIEKLIVEKKQPALFNSGVDFVRMMGISKHCPGLEGQGDYRLLPGKR
ncbi:MAG: hypothetical protein U0T82_17920 [Bacteroidales bacterium]